jgi:hypothetical protein
MLGFDYVESGELGDHVVEEPVVIVNTQQCYLNNLDPTIFHLRNR